jgi:hypothetical protein
VYKKEKDEREMWGLKKVDRIKDEVYNMEP